MIYNVKKSAKHDEKIGTDANIGMVGLEWNENTSESVRVLFAGLFNEALRKVVEEIAKNKY